MTTTPMQYLDKAMGAVRDLGLMPDKSDTQEEPIIALLNQITELDEEKVIAITRTLSQASLFNDIVREQVQAMDIGNRYEDIVNALYSDNDIVHIDTTIKYEDGRESNIRTDLAIRKIA